MQIKFSNFFFTAIFACIVLLAYLWGWKTSGVLENSMSFCHPEGYRYVIESSYGDWPINKESSYYLLAAQGFLGVDGATLNVGCLYEIYRTFYPFLLRTFWFLDPMEAVWFFDIVIWFLCCISIWKTCINLGFKSVIAYLAVFFTIFGQGFLQSVGEGMGHVAGYASGYFILFLLSQFRTFEKNCEWQKDLIIYAFVGIWQMVYGTAFFYLPIVMAATIYRYYQNNKFNIKQFVLLIVLSLAPYLITSLCVKLFFGSSGGVANIVLERITNAQLGLLEFSKHYVYVLFDSIFSLGPLAFIGFAGLFAGALYKQDQKFKIILFICILQFLVMAFLLMPLAGRGYSTFNFYPFISLGASYLLAVFFEKRNLLGKFFVFSFCGFWIFYTNAALIGFILPSQLFFTGLHNINQYWWGYELRLFT